MCRAVGGVERLALARHRTVRVPTPGAAGGSRRWSGRCGWRRVEPLCALRQRARRMAPWVSRSWSGTGVSAVRMPLTLSRPGDAYDTGTTAIGTTESTRPRRPVGRGQLNVAVARRHRRRSASCPRPPRPRQRTAHHASARQSPWRPTTHGGRPRRGRERSQCSTIGLPRAYTRRACIVSERHFCLRGYCTLLKLPLTRYKDEQH